MKIVGFGACMIDGFPFDKNKSFFSLFINKLNNEYGGCIESDVISLNGFKIERAVKHIRKVISKNPDLVIIQFGALDARANLKDYLNKDKPAKNVESHAYYKIPYIVKNKCVKQFKLFVKYSIKHIIMRVIGLSPTSVQSFTYNLNKIIAPLIEDGCKVVVVSPFIQDDIYTNFQIKRYMKEIIALEKKYGIISINCCPHLSKYNIFNVLMSDGVHLTKKGHEIVANILFEKLKSSITSLTENADN